MKTISKNRILLIALILFTSFQIKSQTVNDGSRYTTNSILSQGNWFKVKITSTGIYKLTYEDLKKIGLSDPSKVKVFGYGGWILDEDFSKTYIDDLPPVSIWMSKEPSSFGPGDYILFYGRGDVKWSYNIGQEEFVQEQNPYSSETFYFITENDSPQNLAETIIPEDLGSIVLTSFDDYVLHEKEITNIAQSGREFFGESFKTNHKQSFNFSLPGITSLQAKIRYEFIAKAQKGTASLKVNVNNNSSLEKSKSISEPTDRYAKASIINDFFTATNLPQNVSVNIEYTPASPSDDNIHLNYVRINYSRKLKPYGGVTLFRSKNLLPQLGFRIAEATQDMLVFEVTNNTNIKKIDADFAGSELTFGASNSSIKEYALIDPSKDIPTPTFVGKITNQNLHSLAGSDMVIIVQPSLQKYAEELANIHFEDSGLKCLIINPELIYNEFSSGKPDATAYRRFMKMFYDRAQTEEEKPKYLLLLGDGTYDNRFLNEEWKNGDNKGILLTYQSVNSISETASYVTDDYFGFLDDNEGTKLSIAKLDIGVGRLPVRDDYTASTVINKIRNYVKNEDNGLWQSTITLVADDAVADSNSASSEISHFVNSDALAESVNSKYPFIITNKIYEDTYERVKTALGTFTYPNAQKALTNSFNEGTLVLNYIGHGSSRGWSHENLSTYSDVERLTNSRLPLWITATCDYSRFDGNVNSGGEAALLNPKGGAISLFSTVRTVYASNNKNMNEAIFKYLFVEENGQKLRLGDIFRRAKCESKLSEDENKLRFSLLGDPALRLNYPTNSYQVKVTQINDEVIGSNTVQIKALSNVTIKGEIVDNYGYPVSNFNGTLQSLIYDNQQNLKTRGNKNEGETYNTVKDYKDYTNTVFSGKSNIENSKFEFSFTAPKDILYTEGFGKMVFYAKTSDGSREAQGSFSQYNVGGYDESVVQETNAPVITKVYLNEESFNSGDKVNIDPVFYAEVSDDSGINLSSAIGHNISLILDGQIEYNLTPTFESKGTSSKVGTVKYLIPDLTEGKHSLQFKVWDIWNNSSTRNIDFEVVNENKAQTYNATIADNPAKDKVKFMFTSAAPQSNVNVRYEVFSLNGALQWRHEENCPVNVHTNYTYEWNLIANNGTKMQPGVYLCNIIIKVNDVEVSTKSEKLIILGQ